MNYLVNFSFELLYSFKLTFSNFNYFQFYWIRTYTFNICTIWLLSLAKSVYGTLSPLCICLFKISLFDAKMMFSFLQCSLISVYSKWHTLHHFQWFAVAYSENAVVLSIYHVQVFFLEVLSFNPVYRLIMTRCHKITCNISFFNELLLLMLKAIVLLTYHIHRVSLPFEVLPYIRLFKKS